MSRRVVRGAVAALLMLLACAVPAHARGLSLGVMDFGIFEGAEQDAWYGRAQTAGVQTVRLTAYWASIAPTSRARLSDPTDPGDPGYDWRGVDAAIAGAGARGIRVLLTVQSAPRWAEGGNRPSWAKAGTWRPDPAAFADFMEAVARRYDGAHGLPRVRNFQPWNEPNLTTYLTPQWTGRKANRKPASPGWYRRMLTAAAARIKAVHADNTVVAAGTAPYGDPPSVNNRMTPVNFTRELLCLRGNRMRRFACGKRPVFDAIDHHPYATGSPTDKARLGENVAIPDLHKLTRILRAARSKGTTKARGVWVTEISWDSKPPDPNGVPERTRARWLQDSFYSLWRQGATTICWFLLRDQPPEPGYGQTYQSGLYTLRGSAKLSVRAFRLPFVARRSVGRTRVWGHTVAAGPVTIERRSGGRWVRAATLRSSGGVFEGRVSAPRGARLRARAGSDLSLERTVH